MLYSDYFFQSCFIYINISTYKYFFVHTGSYHCDKILALNLQKMMLKTKFLFLFLTILIIYFIFLLKILVLLLIFVYQVQGSFNIVTSVIKINYCRFYQSTAKFNVGSSFEICNFVCNFDILIFNLIKYTSLFWAVFSVCMKFKQRNVHELA